jgi:hypothetical protein
MVADQIAKIDEVRCEEIRPAKVCPLKPCSAEARIAEVRLLEVRPVESRAAEVQIEVVAENSFKKTPLVLSENLIVPVSPHGVSPRQI